jgi:hypothetical protein
VTTDELSPSVTNRASLTLADVRAAFSEIISVYLSGMRSTTRLLDHQLEAARLAQQALNDYLQLLNITEVQAEVEQTQRIVGHMRSNLPDVFEDEEDR